MITAKGRSLSLSPSYGSEPYNNWYRGSFYARMLCGTAPVRLRTALSLLRAPRISLVGISPGVRISVGSRLLFRPGVRSFALPQYRWIYATTGELFGVNPAAFSATVVSHGSTEPALPLVRATTLPGDPTGSGYKVPSSPGIWSFAISAPG